MPANKAYETDSRLVHRDFGSAAMTTTTVIGSGDQGAAMYTEFVTRAVLEALDIASNDELYTLVAELSNASNFSPLVVAGAVDFGATEVRQSGAPDSVAGDEAEMHWATAQNQQNYRYWRLRLIVAGTTPTATLAAMSSRR